jgi:hypothetical protein
MNEPHKMIEREYTWDDFYVLLQGDDQLIRIYQKYNENYTSVRNYDWAQGRIHFSDGKIEFFNGSHVDYKFEKQFNENILYGFGSFYLYSQVFDTIELEETEEVWLMDGMVEDRPIIKELETFTLKEREVKLYRMKRFD